MASQLETLQLIFAECRKIYDKLCEIEERLGGGEKPIRIDVPKFYEQDGSLVLNGIIQTVGGGTQEDQAFTDRLTEVFQGILGALDSYADNPDQDWEELP